MARYVAFLRAINLGSARRFGNAEIRAATEATGATDVATYGGTGNVRLTSSARSAGRVQEALERAYAADRGFDVPVVVFTTAELRELTERGSELRDRHVAGAHHYVTLYAAPPPAVAAHAVQALELPGERCVVAGRAAYAVLDGDVHTSRLLGSREFAALGQGTARTITVLRALVERWC